MSLNDAARGFITNFNFLFKSFTALIISLSIATIAFALSMLVGIGILAIMAAKASTVSAATSGLVAGTVVAAANPIGLIALIAGSALALALGIGFFCKRATLRCSTSNPSSRFLGIHLVIVVEALIMAFLLTISSILKYLMDVINTLILGLLGQIIGIFMYLLEVITTLIAT